MIHLAYYFSKGCCISLSVLKTQFDSTSFIDPFLLSSFTGMRGVLWYDLVDFKEIRTQLEAQTRIWKDK